MELIWDEVANIEGKIFSYVVYYKICFSAIFFERILKSNFHYSYLQKKDYFRKNTVKSTFTILFKLLYLLSRIFLRTYYSLCNQLSMKMGGCWFHVKGPQCGNYRILLPPFFRKKSLIVTFYKRTLLRIDLTKNLHGSEFLVYPHCASASQSFLRT